LSRRAAAASLGCVLALSRAASAGVTLEVRPLFGETCLPSAGSGELRVRVENTGSRPLRAVLVVDATAPRPDRPRTRHAWTVRVGARAEAMLSVDTPRPLAGGAMTFRVLGEDRRTLATTTLALPGGEGSMILDATPGHRFANAQRAGAGGLLSGDVGDEGDYGRGGLFRALSGAPEPAALPYAGVTCAVERPAATGSPRLPRLVAGYRAVALVLLDSASLNGLAPSERQSLAGYVAEGGSLAVIVRSPNDLRHPVLGALVGDGVSAFPMPSWSREPEVIDPWRVPRVAPQAATLAGARTWGGGHLDPRWLAAVDRGVPAGTLGATARYGDGVVHLLSWDPSQTASLEDPWSARTVLQLAAHADHRRAPRLFAPEPETLPIPGPVRSFLSPSARPGLDLLRAGAIVAAFASALLLAAWMTRRLGARSLFAPVCAALTLAAWALLAREGGAHRAALVQARTLSVLDAPWGFSVASARRFHMVYSGHRRSLAIHLGGPERVVAVDPTAGRGPITRLVAPDAAHLVGLGVLPWTPTFVREDGPEELRGAVTLHRAPTGELSVRNGLPWALREVLLLDRGSSSGWSFEAIAPGRTRSVREGRALPRSVVGWFVVPELPALPGWGSPEAAALARRPPSIGADAPGDVAAPLGRWFGHRRDDNPWDAVLASAAVPGRAEPWVLREGACLVARIDRPAAATRAGLRLASESTWLRVHPPEPTP